MRCEERRRVDSIDVVNGSQVDHQALSRSGPDQSVSREQRQKQTRPEQSPSISSDWSA